MSIFFLTVRHLVSYAALGCALACVSKPAHAWGRAAPVCQAFGAPAVRFANAPQLVDRTSAQWGMIEGGFTVAYQGAAQRGLFIGRIAAAAVQAQNPTDPVWGAIRQTDAGGFIRDGQLQVRFANPEWTFVGSMHLPPALGDANLVDLVPAGEIDQRRLPPMGPRDDGWRVRLLGVGVRVGRSFSSGPVSRVSARMQAELFDGQVYAAIDAYRVQTPSTVGFVQRMADRQARVGLRTSGERFAAGDRREERAFLALPRNTEGRVIAVEFDNEARKVTLVTTAREAWDFVLAPAGADAIEALARVSSLEPTAPPRALSEAEFARFIAAGAFSYAP